MGKEGERKLQQRYVEKLHTQTVEMRSKYGEMENRQDPSSTSMNVLKQPEDSWIRNLLAPSTSDQKRW